VHRLQLFAQDSFGNASATENYFFEVRKAVAAAMPTVKPPVPVPSVPIAGAPSTPHTPSPSGTEPVAAPVSPTIPPVAVAAPSVTPQAPAALGGGWSLLGTRPFAPALTLQDVEMLVEKFPEFRKTFQELGLTDFKDGDRLRNVNLALPSLTQALGLSSDLSPAALPAVSTPLAQVPVQLKQGIPENIVFIKTAESGIDVNAALSFEDGSPSQKVNLLSDQSYELLLRPDAETKAVTGYLTLKGRQVSLGKESPSSTVFGRFAALFHAGPTALAQETEEKMVLSEFAYGDEDGDGIWTAKVSTPAVSGEYEVITVLDYKDVKIGSKTLRLITVVDPEGYVFESVRGQELHIKNASVSLFWFDPQTNRYELWDAGRFQQANPQTTDERGTYSFLVPPGSYYLKVEAPGYAPYQGEPFDVQAGNGVHTNLELIPKKDWKTQLTWERILLLAFGIALVYNFYSDRKARRKRNP
jgi:hypothetical protein